MSLLQALRNNSPAAKPELWRNLPRALLRKTQCRFRADEITQTVVLDGNVRMKVDLRTAVCDQTRTAVAFVSVVAFERKSKTLTFPRNSQQVVTEANTG